MEVADALKRFRKEQGLSQIDVARVLGITRQSYNSYEKDAMPNSRLIIKLADAYNVSADYLLGRIDTPQNSNAGIDRKQLQAAVNQFCASIGLSQNGNESGD